LATALKIIGSQKKKLLWGLAMIDEDFLALVPLFSGLKPEDLRSLAESVHHHIFEADEEIVAEGDSDRRLFIIVSGSVEVIKSRGLMNERKLGTFGPRDYFGEMALIDNLNRSASVIAKETTELVSLNQEDFQTEIEKNPVVAFRLLQVLSQRIRVLEKMLMNNIGGLIPICMNCKNIRDVSGSWVKIEEYISDHSEADFSHGICPECLKKLYPKHFGSECQK
jgi:CRP-like cAMP-binding protein